MKRAWIIWLLFALCVTLAGGALARVGDTALRLEREEATMRRQAVVEERLQLALWRMDSALAPLVAEEGTRPYFAYSPFYPAERAYTAMFAEIQRGDVLVPSPLLTATSPQVRLHFQIGQDGRLTSPQVPTGNMRDLAEARYLSPERVEESAHRLTELERLVGWSQLAAALDDERPLWACPTDEPVTAGDANAIVQQQALEQNSEPRSSNEFVMRNRSTQMAQAYKAAPPAPIATRAGRVTQGPTRAVWVGTSLFLARRVSVEDKTFFQGCWLDWAAIRSELLASVADLLESPSLEPVRSVKGLEPTRMLAALPVRIVPLPSPVVAAGWSPVALSLLLVLGCLVVAALAVAILLQGTLVLSERRGTFVSAVTHELRTPLTTFRLYTEMLTEEMVPDEATRRSYLQTLRAEADRLGHLIENVLAFSRLERGRAVERREVVTTVELFDRLGPSLVTRASQAGMELLVQHPEAPTRIRTDVSVVGQILSNLVDNACKYASATSDRRIHLEATIKGTRLALEVHDHGPGISRHAARRLFRPFSKSASDAAQSVPGVGLGLALSRRLARVLCGDLCYLPDGRGGARFSLTLPLC